MLLKPHFLLRHDWWKCDSNPSPLMIRHFALIALRSFVRFKNTFIVNVVGLTSGLSCALFIYLWVQDEYMVNAYHENRDRLYQVLTNHHNADGIVTMDATPDPLAETLASSMPEVEYAAAATPSSWFGDFVLEDGDNKTKAMGEFVANDYFRMFTIPVIRGNISSLLTDKNSIVISQSLAHRMFGTDDIIGKTITWRLVNISNLVKVTGVFQDLPSHSSERFDFVLSFEYWKQMLQSQDNWGNYNASAYVLLRDGTDPARFNDKIRDFLDTKVPETSTTLLLQRYDEKYLNGNYENGLPAGGRIQYARLFLIIAGFILVIACINFMNLSTARATRRMKEIGIKKAFGVGRGSLALQYLTESTLISILCLILAVALVDLALPLLDSVTGKSLQFHWSAGQIAVLLIIGLATGLLAGSYPALLMSGYAPGDVLKGRIPSTGREGWARKGLVVFQFSITIILFCSVMVVYKQIQFIQTKGIGFDKDHVIHFQKEGAIANKLDEFLSAVRQLPEVEDASAISQNVIDTQAFTGDVSWPGKDETQAVKFAVLAVDERLIETLGMEMALGRSYSDQYNDTARLIFNESAIRTMGLDDPIGQRIRYGGRDREIIGVVKDFHFQSLHETVKPMVMLPATQPLDLHHVVVRLAAGSEAEGIEKIRTAYENFNPGYVFDFQFLDQDFQHQYNAELRVSSLSKYFAVMAITISCLGLFGLVTFTAEQRRKEIGIRKALGSSSLAVMLLLTSEFTRIVLLAIAIGIPLSWIAAREWLSTFAFSIELNWLYFALGGICALALAWATVAGQALKASMAKPADVLRSE